MAQVTSCDELARELGVFPLCWRIMVFFLNHPDAMDTPEGVADWWLQEDRRPTKDALDRLTALGLVVRRTRGGRELCSYTDDASLRAMAEELYARPKTATPQPDRAETEGELHW